MAEYRWFLWAAAVCLTFILGYVGFHQHYASAGHRSFADLVYLSLQLFPLQSGALPAGVPWELQIARIAAPALAAVGIIGAVTALSVCTNARTPPSQSRAASRRVREWVEGERA
jgi:hypothetical protein